MNKLMKNISMLALVAMTVTACGGGGGGAGTAVVPPTTPIDIMDNMNNGGSALPEVAASTITSNYEIRETSPGNGVYAVYSLSSGNPLGGITGGVPNQTGSTPLEAINAVPTANGSINAFDSKTVQTADESMSFHYINGEWVEVTVLPAGAPAPTVPVTPEVPAPAPNAALTEAVVSAYNTYAPLKAAADAAIAVEVPNAIAANENYIRNVSLSGTFNTEANQDAVIQYLKDNDYTGGEFSLPNGITFNGSHHAESSFIAFSQYHNHGTIHQDQIDNIAGFHASYANELTALNNAKAALLNAVDPSLAALQTAVDNPGDNITVSNTYAIKPQGSLYVIYNVDTNTNFGTFSSITGALGYSVSFDELDDSANYEQFDADGNLVSIYGFVDGAWIDILPAAKQAAQDAFNDQIILSQAGVTVANTIVNAAQEAVTAAVAHNITVSDTYAIKPQGSQYVIYNVDTNTDFGTFSSITGALGYSTEFDGLADSANYEQFDADGNLVSIYGFVDGAWTNILPTTYAAQIATANNALATAKADLFDTTGFDFAGISIGSNGYGATSVTGNTWDVVNGDNSDSYFINNDGTGEKNPLTLTEISLVVKNNAANTSTNFNQFYVDARDAQLEGWTGTGITIASSVNSVGSGTVAAIAPDSNIVSGSGTISCVRQGTHSNCSADNGITFGAGQELHLTNTTNGISAGPGINGIVSAGAALVWNKFDTLDQDEIQDLILETADDATTGTGNLKVINLGKALSPVGNLN